MTLSSRIAAILGEPATTGPLLSIPATCPSCGGTLEVDHVSDATSRTADAEVTCQECGREFVVMVAIRAKAKAGKAVA